MLYGEGPGEGESRGFSGGIEGLVGAPRKKSGKRPSGCQAWRANLRRVIQEDVTKKGKIPTSRLSWAVPRVVTEKVEFLQKIRAAPQLRKRTNRAANPDRQDTSHHRVIYQAQKDLQSGGGAYLGRIFQLENRVDSEEK